MAWGRKKSGARKEPQFGLGASLAALRLSPEDRIRFYCEFDRDAMLSADMTAKGEFLSKMIQNGQMTPNEGRKKANRAALEGGDILLINSTLIPLTDAGRLGGRQPKPGAIDAPPTPAEGHVP